MHSNLSFSRNCWPWLEKGDKKPHPKPSKSSDHRSIETHLYWGWWEVWQWKCVQSAWTLLSCISCRSDNHCMFYCIYHQKVEMFVKRFINKIIVSRKKSTEARVSQEMSMASNQLSAQDQLLGPERRSFCRSCRDLRGNNPNAEHERHSRNNSVRYKAGQENCQILRDTCSDSQ